MDKTQVLLSQSEIDALLNFLTDNQVSSEIMSQDSIDKLVGFLQSNDTHTFRTEDFLSAGEANGTSVLLLPGDESILSPGSLRLTASVDSNDFLVFTCVNTETGNSYEITPESADKLKYFYGSSNGWGKSVAPRLFDIVAALLNSKYTKETYDFIYKRYAEYNYGSADIQIPAFVVASEDALKARMI